MEKPTNILGIDVSKLKIDVCLISDGKEKLTKFENSASGFQRLSDFLLKHGAERVHACMEATGKYYEPLALYLSDAGHFVSVVNPFRIKGYATSELKRSKTDRIDAGVIARFTRSLRPGQWTPHPQEVREMQDAERYLESLKSNLRQELNRLESSIKCRFVVASIERHVQDLRLQIRELELWMKRHIKAHERLNSLYKLLTSVIGIGDVAAMTYLGELGYADSFEITRQAESFVGLTPRKIQSGSSAYKDRLSKAGNCRMRKALYMPALTAMKHNPTIRIFAERLRAAGKAPKIVICAVMRKLLRMMFAIAKSGKPFDLSHCTRPS